MVTGRSGQAALPAWGKARRRRRRRARRGTFSWVVLLSLREDLLRGARRTEGSTAIARTRTATASSAPLSGRWTNDGELAARDGEGAAEVLLHEPPEHEPEQERRGLEVELREHPADDGEPRRHEHVARASCSPSRCRCRRRAGSPGTSAGRARRGTAPRRRTSGRLMTSSIRLPIHMLAMIPQKSRGLFTITSGPGTMPWMVIAPTISAITAFGGIPRARSGMKEVCAPALFADSGPATPSMRPAPEAPRVLRELLLDRVGRERAEHRAVPGEDPEHRAEQGAAEDGPDGAAEVLAGREDAPDRAASRRPGAPPPRGCGAPRRTRRAPSRAPRSRCRPRAARSRRSSARRRCRGPCPTVERRSPRRTIAIAFGIEPRASTTAKARPATMSEKYSAGPKSEREPRERDRERGDDERRDAAREERADGGDAEGGPGAPLLRHLVPVERRDDRGHLAGDVHEDGGGRAAVLRAVVDAGEHDERAGRLDGRR